MSSKKHTFMKWDQMNKRPHEAIYLIILQSFYPMGTTFSAKGRCHTAISRNDPISLSNEIYKLLDNSPSDKPFHVIFSVNYE